MWTLNREGANKLLASEMDFCKSSASKSSKENFLSDTIRETFGFGKNVLE